MIESSPNEIDTQAAEARKLSAVIGLNSKKTNQANQAYSLLNYSINTFPTKSFSWWSDKNIEFELIFLTERMESHC